MENNGGRRGVETRGRRTRRGTQTTKTAEIGHERKILRHPKAQFQPDLRL
jgi:hypothetical protein